MHNIVYILIVLISCTFADVAFVTKPPEEVNTFPGQQVTLPCEVENLPDNQIVQWIYVINIHSFIVISDNRNILKTTLENIGEDFSIIGDEMNFTLLFKIPDKIEFGSDLNFTTLYQCSVLNSDGKSYDIYGISNVIIHRLKILNPICGKIKTYFIIGDILKLGCYNYVDPTVITTLKSRDGKVLPTYLDQNQYIIHNLTLTKWDHNAMFVCESRRNGTNEIKNCSIGPITVNYKPEINITQTSATEFHCTADARPPVNVTHWIVESIIPKDNFIISNGVIRFKVPLKVDFEMKITCEAENTIGRANKTLSIPNVNNRDEENGSGNIPTVKNQDKDDGSDSTSVIIVVICVVFCVVVAFIIILLILRRKRIKHQQTSNSRNISAIFRSDDPQVERKNKDPKELVYDYAAIDVNEFRADYQETENEIYVDGDISDETNVANKRQSYTKLKDLDQIRNTVNRAQINTDCEELKNEQFYSQVNKPDYKECENEIYQGPE